MEAIRHTKSTLLALLQGQAGENVRLGCVIDPTRFGGTEGAARALGMGSADFDALPNFHAEFAPPHRSTGPRWLSPSDAEQLQRLSEIAIERQGVMFLFSAGPPSNVFIHLKGLVKLDQPDGSKLLFRWHDAFVLSALAPLLTSDQTAAMLGPVGCWICLDACRREMRLAPPVEATRGSRRLRIDPSQLDQLSRALLPFTIFRQVEDIDSTLLSGLDDCRRLERVDPLLERAEAHGLSTNEDLSLFVALALQLPENFDRSGPVSRALGRTRGGAVGFGEAIDQVPVEEWREWDEELDDGGPRDG